jgi:hypothetical protein
MLQPRAAVCAGRAQVGTRTGACISTFERSPAPGDLCNRADGTRTTTSTTYRGCQERERRRCLMPTDQVIFARSPALRFAMTFNAICRPIGAVQQNHSTRGTRVSSCHAGKASTTKCQTRCISCWHGGTLQHRAHMRPHRSQSRQQWLSNLRWPDPMSKLPIAGSAGRRPYNGECSDCGRR